MTSQADEVNQNNIPDIELIGKALYGEVWVAQLTRLLKKQERVIPFRKALLRVCGTVIICRITLKSN